jgi:hypothetical protein
MNLIRRRIKHLLREIHSQGLTTSPKPKNEFCIITVVFDTNSFNMKCSSIGDFMKRLKNGKITLDDSTHYNRPKQNNRQYFNNLIESGGIYRFVYGQKFIEINIYLDIIDGLDYNIEREIIKSRINKIVSPIECHIEFNNKSLLDKTFRDLSIVDTGWNVFGNEFRTKIFENPIINY